MKYNVFFQLGGHKMQKIVEANNEHHARALIANDILFYKTEIIEKTKEPEKPKKDFNHINNLFEEFFGGKVKF